jgi:hypothetical protein
VAKEEHRGDLNSYLCSRSAYRRQELCTGFATEHGKQPCNVNRNDTNEELVRSKVEKRRAVADEVVVVMTAMEIWKERRASHNRF